MSEEEFLNEHVNNRIFAPADTRRRLMEQYKVKDGPGSGGAGSGAGLGWGRVGVGHTSRMRVGHTFRFGGQTYVSTRTS